MNTWGWIANALIIFCWYKYNNPYGIVSGIVGDIMWVAIAIGHGMFDLATLISIIALLKVRVLYKLMMPAQ